MSFEGHVDWNRMLIGPVWPLEIIGNARADAPAAPAMNLRRVGLGAPEPGAWGALLMGPPRLWGFCAWERFCRREGALPSRRILVSAPGKGNTHERVIRREGPVEPHTAGISGGYRLAGSAETFEGVEW